MKIRGVKITEHYCPECGEPLTPSKGGFLEKKDGTEAMGTFVCNDCDQMYGFVNGKPAFAAFDAKGQPIKVYCTFCNKLEHFRQKMVDICEDGVFYKEYCVDCAIEFLRNTGMFKNERITPQSVRDVADLYSMAKINEVLSDPVKYAAAMNRPEVKEALDGLLPLERRDVDKTMDKKKEG